MSDTIFHRGIRKISRPFLNNTFVNRIFIWFGKEEWIQYLAVNWRNATYDQKKSLEENVGFSRITEIEESRNKMHSILRNAAEQYLEHGSKILEIGCGTGLFLIPLQQDYAVTGIDLSKSFLAKAHQVVPSGKFIEGNFLTQQLPDKYNLIFFESSFQYFVPGKLKHLFKKLYSDMLPSGILIIHYSHALTKRDALYGDLAYVRYTPQVVEENAKPYFNIIEHHHYTDNRIVNGIDTYHYYFPGATNKRTDTNLNTYLLIAQRKQ